MPAVHGADARIAARADDEQRGHEVHREIVRLCDGHVARLLILGKVGDELRPEDRGHGPRGDEPTVNRADLHRAEHVAQIRGDRREAAAIHRDDQRGDADEERHIAHPLRERDEAVEHRTEEEVDEVNALAPGVVARARPEKAAAHIEDAEEPREAVADRLRHAEHALAHVRRLPEDADASGDIQAEHRPQQPELRGLDGLVGGDVCGGHEFLLDGARDESLGLPAGRRHADGHRAEDHEAKVHGAHHEECLHHAGGVRRRKMPEQFAAERRTDERASAEAHDRHPRRHAGPVGKPFHERRDGRDVAEPEADSADDSVAEQHEPKLVQLDAETRDEESPAPATRADEHRLARPIFLDPLAEECSGKPEQNQPRRIQPGHLRDRPVAGRGLSDAEQPRERNIEDAEAVDFADAKMHREGGWRHEPAREAGPGDGTFAIEELHGEMVTALALACRRGPARRASRPRWIRTRLRSERLQIHARPRAGPVPHEAPRGRTTGA